MPRWSIWVIVAVIFIVLVIVQMIVHSEKPVRKAISGIFVGVLTLALVNIAGNFTGVTLPVSLLTLGVSGVAGIPGVTMLLLLQMIL